MLWASPSPRTFCENDRAFAVGVGADRLCRLGALAAVLRRLLLTFGFHAGEDRLTVFLGQIGATYADIDDVDAKGLPLGAHLIADLRHNRGALMGKQSR